MRIHEHIITTYLLSPNLTHRQVGQPKVVRTGDDKDGNIVESRFDRRCQFPRQRCIRRIIFITDGRIQLEIFASMRTDGDVGSGGQVGAGIKDPINKDLKVITGTETIGKDDCCLHIAGIVEAGVGVGADGTKVKGVPLTVNIDSFLADLCERITTGRVFGR